MIRQTSQQVLHDAAAAALREAGHEVRKEICTGRDDGKQGPDPGLPMEKKPSTHQQRHSFNAD